MSLLNCLFSSLGFDLFINSCLLFSLHLSFCDVFLFFNLFALSFLSYFVSFNLGFRLVLVLFLLSLFCNCSFNFFICFFYLSLRSWCNRNFNWIFSRNRFRLNCSLSWFRFSLLLKCIISRLWFLEFCVCLSLFICFWRCKERIDINNVLQETPFSHVLDFTLRKLSEIFLSIGHWFKFRSLRTVYFLLLTLIDS